MAGKLSRFFAVILIIPFMGLATGLANTALALDELAPIASLDTINGPDTHPIG